MTEDEHNAGRIAAVHVASTAAVGVSGLPQWWTATAEHRPPGREHLTADGASPNAASGPAAELAAFVRANRQAPAEALFIRGGALGVHDGAATWGEISEEARLAYEVFGAVLNLIDAKHDERRRRVIAVEKAQAAQRAAPVFPVSETIMAQEPGPTTPLEGLEPARPAGVPKSATWSRQHRRWQAKDGRRWNGKGERLDKSGK